MIYGSYFSGTHSNNIMELLLEAGAGPNALGRSGYSALMIACAKYDTEIVKLLFKYSADYSQCISKNGIPFDSFAFACAFGYSETVCFLQDNVYLSPTSVSVGWCVACLYNKSDLIEYLVYSLFQLSSDKRELVIICVKRDLAFIKSKFHDYVDTEFVHGVTLMMIASSCGKASIMQYLLDSGVSILKEDEFGFKAIDYIDKNSSSLCMVKLFILFKMFI